MSEPAGQFGHDDRGGDAPADDGPAAPGDVLPYPHCSRCHTDLTHCLPSARFCPRCGLLLLAPPPAAALAGETRVVTVPPVPLPPPLPLPPLAVQAWEPGGTHSLILGFANAMFRLGWRYENGDGTCRNAQEAVRCYFKAAKLGNASAQARLTPRDVVDGSALPQDTGGRASDQA